MKLYNNKATPCAVSSSASLVLLLLLVCCGHLFRSTTAMSQLNIVSPEVIEGQYDHRDAYFGNAPYGSTLEMPVYYAGSELCNPTSVSLDSDSNSNKPSPPVADWKPPFLLMIDRGTCTFVTKARNAELYQASGIIIADHVCVCDDETNSVCQSAEVVPDVLYQPCQQYSPQMSDDGTGSDIRIPSILLKKQDAEKIITQLANGSKVQAQVTFDVPDDADQVVDYELWMNPIELGDDGHGQELATGDWKQAAIRLGSKASFTPRMLLLDGAMFGCDGSSTPECQFYCTNNGKYCAYDPKILLPGSGITGAQIVYEMLKRLCIWETYGKEDGIGIEFWDYMYQFYENCNDGSDEACTLQALETANINAATIDQCIVNSGGLEGDINSILEEQVMARNDEGIIHTPYLLVNQVPVSGRKTYGAAFKAICSGFSDGSAPNICDECADAPTVDECVAAAEAPPPPVSLKQPPSDSIQAAAATTAGQESSTSGNGGGGVQPGVIAGSVIAVVVALGLVVLIMKRTSRQKQNREVGSNVLEAEVSAKASSDGSGLEPTTSAEGTESSIL